MLPALLTPVFLGILPLFLTGYRQKLLRLPIMFVIANTGFIVSATLYHFASPIRFNLFGLDNYMGPTDFWETLEKFLGALIAYMIGSLVIRGLLGYHARISRNQNRPGNSGSGGSNFGHFLGKIPFWPIPIAFFVCICLYLLLYLTSSWSLVGLWMRDQYVVDGAGSVKIVLILMNTIFFAYAGLFSYVRRHNQFRSFILLFATLLLIFELSTGSRKFILYLALYLFLPAFLSAFRRREWLIRLGLVALSIFYVIPLRSLPIHGLLAYSGLGSLLGVTPSPLSEAIKQAYFAVYYNMVLGFYVTSYVMNAGVASLHSFVVSINPLTSNFIGWYDIAPTLRISLNAPFNLYGEVFALGDGYTWLFFIALGGYFTLMDRWIYLKRIQRNMWALIPTALLIMFIVFAYEYNLRTGMRLLYYALGFVSIYTIIIKIRRGGAGQRRYKVHQYPT